MRALAALLALSALGCTPAPESKPDPGYCRYRVQPRQDRGFSLHVDAECSGSAVEAFVASESSAARRVSRLRASGMELSPSGARWSLPKPTNHTSVSYDIDLAAVAADNESFDVALRVGDSLLAPASTWLLRPEPAPIGLPVEVSVGAGPGMAFATGLSRKGSRYWLEAHELRVATYSVFGRFSRDQLTVPGFGEIEGHAPFSKSRIDIVSLDGQFSVDRPTRVRWVEDASRAVAAFWGGFPAPNTLVALIPVPDRDKVVFGKVLPESAPGVSILIGENADRAALYSDWILIHELFHLGFPSFYREGKWLDEGLATYYEPIIRVRTGNMRPEEMWTQFAHAMPLGLPALERDGLDNTTDYRGIYWGGALLCLLADVDARRGLSEQVGLERGLRGLLRRGGHASEVWSLKEAIRVIDEELGMPVLDRLYRRHGRHGVASGFRVILRQLGVIDRGPDQEVAFDDKAPLAYLRREIAKPPPSPAAELASPPASERPPDSQ